MDTIVALATAPVSSAVGIVRMSGDAALMIASKIFCAKGFDRPVPRMMYLGTVTAGNIKDKAFCIYYKAPQSYTGEDVVEFQTHGGVALTAGVVRALVAEGARPAEPGEFTKRAYLNGKLDLVEAEGIADLINAKSEAEIRGAYRMMSGELSRTIARATELLLQADAALEVALDYPEELLEDTKQPVLQDLITVRDLLKGLLVDADKRRYITDGVHIVLTGLTNAGKSSLLNAVLQAERAIVTDIAGTTRDTLTETAEIGGMRFRFVDTAGIRESSDVVEQIGVDRARQAIEGADLVLFVKDASLPPSEEERALERSLVGKPVLTVLNKGDVAKYPRSADLTIEAKTGKNVDRLIEMILERFKPGDEGQGAMLRERHVFAVRTALAAVQSALDGYDALTNDCLIVDVKAAYRALASLTGEDVEEAVVDRIFSTFCVGK